MEIAAQLAILALSVGAVITTFRLRYILPSICSYCINIGFYLLLKAKQAPVRNHPVIGRLIQYRKASKLQQGDLHTGMGAIKLNPYTPRIKPKVIQSFLTLDSKDRTLICDHSLESCSVVLYCGAVCFTLSLQE